MTADQIEAVRLLGAYTAGTYDLWSLAGPAKASCRAHIMSALQGRKVPQKESGVTMLRSAFYAVFQPPAGTLAAQETAFAEWCGRVLGRQEG